MGVRKDKPPRIRGYREKRNAEGGLKKITVKVETYKEGSGIEGQTRAIPFDVKTAGDDLIAEARTRIKTDRSRLNIHRQVKPIFAAEKFLQERVEDIDDVITFLDQVSETETETKARIEL